MEQEQTRFLGNGVYYAHEQFPDERYLALYGFGEKILLEKSTELSLLRVLLGDLPHLTDLERDRGLKILHLVGQVASALDFVAMLAEPDSPSVSLDEQTRSSLTQMQREQAQTGLQDVARLVAQWQAEIAAQFKDLDSSSRVSP